MNASAMVAVRAYPDVDSRRSGDAETGGMRWTFVTRTRVDSCPAAAGGRVYIGSADGRFYILDLESCEKLCEFDTGAPLSASPAIAAGKVVIGSQDGVLYCFG